MTAMVSKVKFTIYNVLKVDFLENWEKRFLIYNQYEAPPVGVKKAGMPAPPALKKFNNRTLKTCANKTFHQTRFVVFPDSNKKIKRRLPSIIFIFSVLQYNIQTNKF
jgi:hypothetical protein